MKHMMRRMALLLAIVMIGSSLGCAALAASYKYVTIKSGKALTLKPLTVYKVKVAKYSIVKLEMYNNKLEDRILANLYTTKNLDRDYAIGTWINTTDRKDTVSEVLDKGVYYLRVTEQLPDEGIEVGSNTTKIRVTVTPIVDEKNYSPATAKTVKAKQVVRAAFSPATLYPRWYKIKLRKDQYLNLYLTGSGKDYDRSSLAVSYRIYDSKVKLYNARMVENESTTQPGLVSSEELPAGTYYLRFDFPWNIAYTHLSGKSTLAYPISCYSFFWK